MAARGKQKTQGAKSLLERYCETCLWQGRLAVIVPVVISLAGAFVLIVVGAWDFVSALRRFFLDGAASGLVIAGVISAVDTFLIAVVLLMFAYGLYEMFISHIDLARGRQVIPNALRLRTVDQLKDKIAKIIVMVLAVKFFQKVLNVGYENAEDVLMLAASILVLCLGFWLLHRTGLTEGGEQEEEPPPGGARK